VIRRLQRLGPGLNWRLIVPVVAGVLFAVGLGMLLCAAVALLSGDGSASAFAIPGAGAIVVSAGQLSGARALESVPLRARDGFFAVTMAWLVAATVGAIPFVLEGSLVRPVDAFFESMSGFTTTGATLIDEVEREPEAILLWRSLSQWLGGVGIVVLVVAIAPASGLAHQRVFYAETSGVTPDRLTSRIADTAKIIWGIYLAFTALGCIAYFVAGMGAFDAINHSLTTIATGGFSTRTASIGAFDSLAVEIVAIVFMALAGVNFAFYWRAIRGRNLWPQAAEVRLYVIVLVSAITVVTASLLVSGDADSVGEAVRWAAFSATAVVTSGGFVSQDFDQWDDFARSLLILLTFIGGCAGSTGGGVKVIRILLLWKTVGQEIQRQLRPKAVQVLRTRGRVFSEDVRRAVLGFFSVYALVTIAGTFAMLATGLDLVSAATAAVATINIVGTGLGDVGALENYAAVSDGGRWVLCALMLTGRLEVFTVLVLLTPAFWRPNVA
jgi:trk system potassium uptake protein TrkH